VYHSGEAGVGYRVELDFAGLAGPDEAQVGFGHVGLDLQRAQIGNGHHRRLGVGGRADRRHDVADIGALGQDDGIERSADQGVIQCHRRALNGRAAAANGCIRRRHRRLRPPVAGLRIVVFRLRDDLALEQAPVPLIGQRGERQLCLRLLEVGLGDLSVGHRLIQRRPQIVAFQAGDDLTLLNPAALLDHQIHQAPRDLGSHGRLALGHHIAARVEKRKRLGRIDPGDRHDLDRDGGADQSAEVEC